MPLRRGRRPETKVLSVRELRREELSALREKRVPKPHLQRLRDPHHNLARLIAMGKSIHEAARLAGYSYSRALTLNSDPAFKQCMAEHKAAMDGRHADEIDEYMSAIYGNGIKAERQLTEHLDQADERGELLAIKDLLAISRDSADRVGYGKKQTNINVNVDFAAKLERAIARSGLRVVSSRAQLPEATEGVPAGAVPPRLVSVNAPCTSAPDAPPPVRRIT